MQPRMPSVFSFPFMKYNILINQKACIDAGFNLDIVDLAIFELLKDFALTEKCKKLNTPERQYFLFNWKLVNTQLPILGLNSRQSVFKRFEKLKECELIIPHPDNQNLSQSWYSFGKNYEVMLFRGTVNESLQGATLVDTPDNESLRQPVNNGLHNNSHSNNRIKDNVPASPVNIEEQLRNKKILFLKKVIDWIGVNPNKYPKLMYVDFARHWVESTMMKKKVILRFEEQRFFEIGKRLSTWFQKSKDEILRDYWEKEDKVGTVNDLFKKQILNNAANGQ